MLAGLSKKIFTVITNLFNYNSLVVQYDYNSKKQTMKLFLFLKLKFQISFYYVGYRNVNRQGYMSVSSTHNTQ